MRRFIAAAVLAALIAGAASAAETIIYTYDAKGRVIRVVRSGTVNNGVITSYTHDKADNRSNVTTSGAAH
jgi:opacity protein-like surface antigen